MGEKVVTVPLNKADYLMLHCGEDLSKVIPDTWWELRRHDKSTLTFEEKQRAQLQFIVELAIDALEKIQKIHAQGVIHGDIHANNLLVKDGKIFFVDFGNARMVG